MKISSVFGNAPNGDHPAIFTAAETVKYPKGLRRIFGFLVLNEDQSAPLLNEEGDPLYAVAVCNGSKGKSPKSKPHKICKAMLRPDEYDPVEAALEVPEPEHFTHRNEDGSRRVLWVRVEERQTAGRQLSVVTHIKRPRDGEWECIEGQYEGRSRAPEQLEGRSRDPEQPSERGALPSWLNPDGTYRSLTEDEEKSLPLDKFEMYAMKNRPLMQEGDPWVDEQGGFVELGEEYLDAQASGRSSLIDRARYRLALTRHRAGLPPDHR